MEKIILFLWLGFFRYQLLHEKFGWDQKGKPHSMWYRSQNLEARSGLRRNLGGGALGSVASPLRTYWGLEKSRFPGRPGSSCFSISLRVTFVGCLRHVSISWV